MHEQKNKKFGVPIRDSKYLNRCTPFFDVSPCTKTQQLPMRIQHCDRYLIFVIDHCVYSICKTRHISFFPPHDGSRGSQITHTAMDWYSGEQCRGEEQIIFEFHPWLSRNPAPVGSQEVVENIYKLAYLLSEVENLLTMASLPTTNGCRNS